jgi:SynChlorMet cassette radical SAM/SPASM protein ScmF
LLSIKLGNSNVKRGRDMTEKTENGKYPLTSVYFYLTEGCNLKCRHCWIAPKYHAEGSCPSLPVTFFRTAIREAKPLGLRSVKLTGGEPLMHPDFMELLEVVRGENLALSIETNGLLCTPEVAVEIARSPKRFAAVSIDGEDAETHEWLRGVTGSFEKAKQAVRNLVAEGVKTQVIMTLMKRNASQIEGLVRMAEELGAASVKFNLVQPTARGESLSDSGQTLSVGELVELGRYVERGVAPTTKLRLFFDRPYAFRPLSRIYRGGESGRCAVFNIIGVLAGGEYALCGIGYQVPEFVFGTVGKDRLEEIWQNNRVLVSLRDGLPRKLQGICSQCLMKQACLGTCIAQNYYSRGSLWAPYWFCDTAYRLGLFPESRISGGKRS